MKVLRRICAAFLILFGGLVVFAMVDEREKGRAETPILLVAIVMFVVPSFTCGYLLWCGREPFKHFTKLAMGLSFVFFCWVILIIGEVIQSRLKAKDFFDIIRSGDITAVQATLNKGTDPNAESAEHITVLMYAAGKSDVAIVQTLLAYGAKVNAKDDIGMTALMYAAEHGEVANVQTLLDKGADINARDQWNMTPLMYASLAGQAKVVKLLLYRGADVSVRDNLKGRTALMLATRKGYIDIVQLLKQAGARE